MAARRTLEYAKPATFSPYARNARQHSDAQITKLAAAITEYGFTNPLLVDEKNVLIAGHGRLLAAKQLQLKEVPFIRLTGLSPQQKRALVLSDNRMALESSWDDDLLRLELGDLRDGGFNLDLTGFDAGEITDLFATKQGHTAADDAPALQPRAVTQLGDVWLLGPHRVACGDSTDGAVVTAALRGAKPNLMVTDPPYGVEYDPDWRNRADRANGKAYGARAIGMVKNDDRVDWAASFKHFSGDVAYCWHADRHASAVQASLESAGLLIRSQIIWAKTRLIIGRGHYHFQHEPCWFAVRKGKTGRWTGDRKQTTLWTIEHQKSETGHSTQKPVECMLRPIVNHTRPGECVYDPFLGSGTTVMAAETSGRAAIGIELSPQYVDVAVRRWQAFTGTVATLERTGETFAVVEAGGAKPKRKRAKAA